MKKNYLLPTVEVLEVVTSDLMTVTDPSFGSGAEPKQGALIYE